MEGSQFYSVIYKLTTIHVSEFNTILANEILFITHFNMLFWKKLEAGSKATHKFFLD